MVQRQRTELLFEQLFQSIDIPNLRLRNAVLSDYILYDRPPRRKNLFIPFIFEKAAFNNCLYEDDVTQRVSMNFDFRQWVLSNKKNLSVSMRAILSRRI